MVSFSVIYDKERQEDFERALFLGKLEKATCIIISLKRAPSLRISPSPELTRRYEQNIARITVMLEGLSAIPTTPPEKIEELKAQLKRLQDDYQVYRTVR